MNETRWALRSFLVAMVIASLSLVGLFVFGQGILTGIRENVLRPTGIASLRPGSEMVRPARPVLPDGPARAADDRILAMHAGLVVFLGLAIAFALRAGRRLVGLVQGARRTAGDLQKLEMMYDAVISVDALLLADHSETETFELICKTLVKSGLFDIVGIALPNRRQRLRFFYLQGPGAEVISQWQDEAEDAEVVAWFAEKAFQTSLPQFSNDLSDDPNYPEAQQTALRRLRASRWRSVGAFPILQNDAPYAVLAFLNRAPGFFNVKLRSLGQQLAEVVGFSLQARQLQREVAAQHEREAYLAYHDTLTTLPNRNAILQKIPEAMARARRSERMFVIGMMDLNDFKPVNDTYGHAAGDVVLREIAMRLRAAVREIDTVARLGGDEFILLLEYIERWDDLEQVMERVLSAITMPIVLVGGATVTLGASIGVTVYPLDDAEPELLLRHADLALYEQKSAKNIRTAAWGAYAYP